MFNPTEVASLTKYELADAIVNLYQSKSNGLITERQYNEIGKPLFNRAENFIDIAGVSWTPVRWASMVRSAFEFNATQGNQVADFGDEEETNEVEEVKTDFTPWSNPVVVDRQALRKEYAKEYAYVKEYQAWVTGAREVTDEDGDSVPTNLQASPYWGAHMPYSEQVTLALRLGYYEGLLTNKIDGQRFAGSSYYRLGQILGTMAAKGMIPHDSYKAIVWAVDDLTSFNCSLPLGTETLRIAKEIARNLPNQKVPEPALVAV